MREEEADDKLRHREDDQIVADARRQLPERADRNEKDHARDNCADGGCPREHLARQAAKWTASSCHDETPSVSFFFRLGTPRRYPCTFRHGGWRSRTRTGFLSQR